MNVEVSPSFGRNKKNFGVRQTRKAVFLLYLMYMKINAMKMTGPYWCYTITTPDDMVYSGMSCRKDTNKRWVKGQYAKLSLGPYIDKFGWENMSFFFIDGIKNKEEALKLEDELIQMYSEKGVCINKQRSGGVWSIEGRKEYNRKWHINNIEKARENNRRYRKNNLEKERERDRLRYWKKKNSKPTKEERERMRVRKEKERMRELAKRYMERKRIEKELKKKGYISLF